MRNKSHARSRISQGLSIAQSAIPYGIPSRYVTLWDKAKTDLLNGQDARHVIGSHLCAEILNAIQLVRGYFGNDDSSVAKLMELFAQSAVLTKSTLVANGIKRPTPDKIFREVKAGRSFVLVPASNAIGIVLRHNLIEEPYLDELEELLKSEV